MIAEIKDALEVGQRAALRDIRNNKSIGGEKDNNEAAQAAVEFKLEHLEVRTPEHTKLAKPTGHRLEEPDVDNRSGKLDVSHALAAHAAVRYFHTAAIANHALVLHAAVFAAGTFPVGLAPCST